MQCHNYISDVYNKPSHLKIGENWASNYLQSTCTTTNTMLWVSELTVARWPPCADVLDSAVRHLVFIYIYGGHHTPHKDFQQANFKIQKIISIAIVQTYISYLHFFWVFVNNDLLFLFYNVTVPFLNVVHKLIFPVKRIKLIKMHKKYHSFQHNVSVINISATEILYFT